MAHVKKHKIYKILRLGISYIALIIMAIASILPIYYLFLSSITAAPNLIEASLSGLWPKHLNSTGYKIVDVTNVFYGANFILWLRNSLILAGSTAVLSVIIALIAGYAMSRLDIPGKKALITFIYLITFFPFTATAVAVYLLYAKLHLLNYIGLILAYTGGTSIYNAFIAKVAIDPIPKAYEEIAMVDGLSRFQVFLRIIMRFALPIVALVAVSGFDNAYLDYALAYVFLLNNPKEWTAMLGITYLSGFGALAPPAYYYFAAGAIIMALPAVALFVVSFRMMTRAYSALAGVKQ